MSLFKNKTELYLRLFEDHSLKDDKKDSFIYAYLKKRKNDAAYMYTDRAKLYEYKSAKHEKYVLLRAACILHDAEIISDSEYSDIFMEIAKKEAAGEALTALFLQEPNKAETELEKLLLEKAAYDFFSNRGYRNFSADDSTNKGKSKNDEKGDDHKKRGKEEKTEKVRELRQSPRYVDEIELADSFESYLVLSGICGDNSDTAACSPREIDKDEYFRLLISAEKSKSEEIVVPLYFDGKTGAGIYIIGNKHVKNRSGKSCAVFVLGFSDFDSEKQFGNEIVVDMIGKECKNINEAFECLKDWLGDYKSNYSQFNAEIPTSNKYGSFTELLRPVDEYSEFDKGIMASQGKQELIDFENVDKSGRLQR